MVTPTQAASAPLDYSDISKPEFFPIIPWGPLHGWQPPFTQNTNNGLESMAECGFNVAGFVFPSDVRLCQKLGLGAITLPVDNSEVPLNYRREWRKLSLDQIDQRVKTMVELSGKNPAVKGYFLSDEPSVSDFPALGKAVAAVRKYAPGKLAYINLYPNYATVGPTNTSQLGTSNYTDYLERFVKEVNPQLISYDNYMVEMSQDLSDSTKAARYYSNLLEVRRVALAHHLPYLNIVSANQIRPGTTIPSPANLSFQAYTTLAAGYRGVTWYTYYSTGYRYAPIDSTGRKTLTWAYLKEVNRQLTTLAPIMSRLESTAVFFSAPSPVENLPLLPGNLVASATCPTSLMIGEFKHCSGQSYVMVVNLSLERSGHFTLQTKVSDQPIQIISAMDGSLSPYDNKNGVWLTAGQGVLLLVGN